MTIIPFVIRKKMVVATFRRELKRIAKFRKDAKTALNIAQKQKDEAIAGGLHQSNIEMLATAIRLVTSRVDQLNSRLLTYALAEANEKSGPETK